MYFDLNCINEINVHLRHKVDAFEICHTYINLLQGPFENTFLWVFKPKGQRAL